MALSLVGLLSGSVLGFSRPLWSQHVRTKLAPCMSERIDAAQPLRVAGIIDDNSTNTAFAAFTSVVAESPLLRQYAAARPHGFKSRYKYWYAAIAADEELYESMTPEQREAHDRAIAAKVAADAARERARAAALEQAVSGGTRIARATAELFAEACIRGAQGGGRIREAMRARSQPRGSRERGVAGRGVRQAEGRD